MHHISRLSFVEAELENGRHFFKYLIDGKSFQDELPSFDRDFVTPFGWTGEYQNEFLRWLKLEEEGPFADANFKPGRVPLLTCPIDADVDCGGLLARVTEDDGVITWSDFGHGVTYEPAGPPDEHPEIAAIFFDAGQYRDALNEIVTRAELEQHVKDPEPLPSLWKMMRNSVRRRWHH